MNRPLLALTIPQAISLAPSAPAHRADRGFASTRAPGGDRHHCDPSEDAFPRAAEAKVSHAYSLKNSERLEAIIAPETNR